TSDEKKRVLELHERVNNLPDPNYSTLKYLMGHLHKVVQNQEKNKMNVQNLGIVFGPTLMGSPVVTAVSNSASSSLSGASLQNSSTAPIPYVTSDSGGLNDMAWQCKVVETILENYLNIFVYVVIEKLCYNIGIIQCLLIIKFSNIASRVLRITQDSPKTM
ncbi:2465_t:CDS:2, partial [Scutellospora calospora]